MKQDPQRVLAGSLNLLTPSDKTPENDAIELRNFRVDQAGVLRGADTFEILHNFGAQVHTIFRLDNYSTTQAYTNGVLAVTFGGPAFLVGAGTTLYFYLKSINTSYTVATGFSGNPVGIVVWNGFIWVMDATKQIKIDPWLLTETPTASASTWLPPAPTTALTATADTNGFTGAMSGTYSYFVTFAYFSITTNPTTGAVTTVDLESAVGPSVTGIVAVNGICSIESLPLFSGTFGEVRLYRAGGTQAHAYRIKTWYLGAGSFPSASQPYIDYASDASLTGRPQSPSSGATGAPATPTARPTAVGGAVVQSTQQNIYTYYETFVNNAGLETNPGPSSTAVQSLNGLIHLTSIPVSGDTSVYRRRIYREGGTLAEAYQVTEITDNTTTTYDDSLSDLQLTDLGIVMPVTNDPPPAVQGLAGPFFNTLLAWGGGRLYWSQDGVALFPGSEPASDEGSWVDVGAPDDAIQSVQLHTRMAAIHKARTIWRLLGDAETGTLEQTGATCGALGIKAVANAGVMDGFISKDGLFAFDMGEVQLLGDKVSPVFLGQQWIQLGASDILQDIWNFGGLPNCAYLNGTVFLSDGAGTAFLFHVGTQRWASFNSNIGSPITASLAWGSQYRWYAGDAAGNLLEAQQQAASGQLLVWQTRFLDQGLGDQPKQYEEVVLDAELNGATAVVYILFNNTANAPSRAAVTYPFKWTLTGTSRQKFYLPLTFDDGDEGQQHISVRVEISPAGTSVPPAIHGLYIYYHLEARDAGVERTQVMDFHAERVLLCRKIEIDSVDQVDIGIYTDEPGGEMAARYGFAGAPGGKRGIQEFPVPSNLRGRLWRIECQPQATTARVYAIRGWMRSVGDSQEVPWEWRDFLLRSPGEQPDAE